MKAMSLAVFLVSYTMAQGDVDTGADTDTQSPDTVITEPGWIERNPWIFSVMFMAMGPVIALRGLKWLQSAGVALAGIFVGVFVMGEGIELGWVDGTYDALFLAFICILLAAMAGVVTRQNIKILLRLVAGIAGWYLGKFTFAIITVLANSSVTGWWNFVFPAILAITLALSLSRPRNNIIIVQTSWIGSYMFAIAWVWLFPEIWPTREY